MQVLETNAEMFALCDQIVHEFSDSSIGMAMLVLALESIVRDFDTKSVEELQQSLPHAPFELLERWKLYATDFVPVLEAMNKVLVSMSACASSKNHVKH